jgi:hypothetical protein
VPVEQLRKCWRADLLLALDEYSDTYRRPSAERPQRSEVNREPALVVSHTAAVEPPIMFSCHEGRCTPAAWISLRLDIVMGIEANGRHALGRGEPAENGRRTVICADHPDIWAVQIRQELHDTLRTALHVCGPRRVGAHRLNLDERFQIGENAGKLGLDLVTKRHWID